MYVSTEVNVDNGSSVGISHQTRTLFYFCTLILYDCSSNCSICAIHSCKFMSTSGSSCGSSLLLVYSMCHFTDIIHNKVYVSVLVYIHLHSYVCILFIYFTLFHIY